MKKTLIIALAVLVATGMMASTAFAGAAGAAGAGKTAPVVETDKTAPVDGEVKKPGRGEGRRGRGGDWTKRFDTDGDGTLSDEEKAKMEEARKERMAKIDTDGDGKISQEEREAARKSRGDRPRRQRSQDEGAKKREGSVE